MKKPFQLARTTIAVVVAFSTGSLWAQPPQYDHVYVFGDSYSDNGNFYRQMQGQAPASPPYYQGRFSNGPLWIEYLAGDLGLSGKLTDLAYSGAGSGLYNVYVSDPSSPLHATGLLSQVANFIQGTASVDPNALYVIWAGLNDYARTPLDPLTVVSNIENAITSLTSAGAKSILVVNLPNLGQVPGTNGNPQSAAAHAALTVAHNTELAAELVVLRQRLPGVKLIELDVDLQFAQMIAHGTNYGFVDTIDSCIGNTGYPPMPPSTISVSCAAGPNKVLFWDSIHPTTAAHRFIASQAYSVLSAAAVAPGGAADSLSIASVLKGNGLPGAPSAGAPITIFGSGLAGALLPATFPLTIQLETTTVNVNGIPAPLYFVAPGQIKAQVPWETLPGAATVTVSNGNQSVSLMIDIAPLSPAIFSGDGVHAAAFNQDGSSNASAPAARGSVIALYAMGLGPVSPPVATGATASSTILSSAVDPVTATVAGASAQVLFAGLAPETVGLCQVNILVPADTPPGLVPVVLTVAGQSSTPAMIFVR